MGGLGGSRDWERALCADSYVIIGFGITELPVNAYDKRVQTELGDRWVPAAAGYSAFRRMYDRTSLEVGTTRRGDQHLDVSTHDAPGPPSALRLDSASKSASGI